MEDIPGNDFPAKIKYLTDYAYFRKVLTPLERQGDRDKVECSIQIAERKAREQAGSTFELTVSSWFPTLSTAPLKLTHSDSV